jgi:Zn finger protein HypA/HybF involved in hydrogenase expression
MIISMELPKLQCKRCGHEWIPRKKEVRICPKCSSPYWDVEPIIKKDKNDNKKVL